MNTVLMELLDWYRIRYPIPMGCWAKEKPEPGITWTRTDGRTWRVEIVR